MAPTAEKRRDSVDLGHGLSARVVEITPELAQRWLESNHLSNRTVSDSRVEAMANDMRSNNWRLTHQGICFDAQGILIDGQHRLWAIVTSKCAIRILVVGNEHGGIGDPIDTNRNRSVSFLTSTRPNVVSAANVLRFLEAGCKLKSAQTPAETMNVLEHHREHVDAIRALPKCHSMAGPLLGACAYARPLDPAAVDKFSHQLATGEMIQAGDPAFQLRVWIAGTGKSASNWERALATLGAVRYAIHGETIRAVYAAEDAYRGVTSRRRALKVPHTPSPDLVPGGSWSHVARKAK